MTPQGEPIKILSHAEASRLTHAASVPEELLIVGWTGSPFHAAQPLEHIHVIEPIYLAKTGNLKTANG